MENKNDPSGTTMEGPTGGSEDSQDSSDMSSYGSDHQLQYVFIQKG